MPVQADGHPQKHKDIRAALQKRCKSHTHHGFYLEFLADLR